MKRKLTEAEFILALMNYAAAKGIAYDPWDISVRYADYCKKKLSKEKQQYFNEILLYKECDECKRSCGENKTRQKRIYSSVRQSLVKGKGSRMTEQIRYTVRAQPKYTCDTCPAKCADCAHGQMYCSTSCHELIERYEKALKRRTRD